MNLKQKIMKKDALAKLLRSSPDVLKEFKATCSSINSILSCSNL